MTFTSHLIPVVIFNPYSMKKETTIFCHIFQDEGLNLVSWV